MGGKTKSTTTENKTQTAAPPAFTAPGLSTAATDVTNAIGAIPAQHYAGPQVATADPAQLKAIQDAYTATAGQAGQYTDYMAGRLPGLSTPYNFSTTLPTASLDINPVIQAALDPVYKQLTQQILPGIKSSALDSGAYTGDRAMIVAPQVALQDYARQAQNTAATIGYQNYNDTQNRQLAGYQAETQRGLGQEANNNQSLSSIADYVTSILHNSASVGDLLSMASNAGINNQQATINDALARDKYASYSPFMGLDEASQLLASLSGNYGTTNMNGTSTTVQQQTPGLLDYIKAGVGIASAIAGVPGIGGGGGGGGGAINISPTAGSQFPGMLASNIFGH